MAKEQRKRLLARTRDLEVWVYMSSPFAYGANGVATVEWPRINQTTWNGAVGMFALATNPMATWRNIVTSLRFVNNETIIGDGCPLALLASENRVTAQDFLTAPAPPFGLNPNFKGIGWWPGQQFELLGGIQVGAVPLPATATVRMQLENFGAPGDDDIDRIGLVMVEIPKDKGATNYEQLLATWELLERGFGGLSFATHNLVAPNGGASNIEDELLLQTWHSNNLRRVDMRGGFVQLDPLGRFADESLYRLVDFNTRSDNSRDSSEGFMPASCVTGWAGQSSMGLWTLDFRGKGSDRETIVANTPAIGGVNEGLLHFVSFMQGIGEMRYGGRQSGEAF